MDTAEFSGAIFNLPTSFSKCVFHSETKFIGTTFNSRTDFEKAQFMEKTVFVSTLFKSTTGTEFHNFYDCTFNSSVDFTGSVFEGRANFATATFLGESEFSFVTFKNLIASDTKFLGFTRFYQTNFYHVTFAQSRFFIVDFSFSAFHNIALFHEIHVIGQAHFHNLSFANGQNVIFRNVHMKNISFQNSTISRLRFIDVDWNMEQSPSLYDERMFKFTCPLSKLFSNDKNVEQKRFFSLIGLSNCDIESIELEADTLKFYVNVRFEGLENKIPFQIFHINNNLSIYIYKSQMLLPEFHIDNNSLIHTKISLEEVISIYNELRDNYEFYLRYETAGYFFKKIMEYQQMYKRITVNNKGVDTQKYVKKGEIKSYFSFHGIYKILSDYGESLYRPLLWGIVFLLVTSAALFAYEKSLPEPKCLINLSFLGITCEKDISYFDSLLRISSNFIPFIGFSNDNPTFLDISVKAIGFVIFGLWFISLRRRFERRFRH